MNKNRAHSLFIIVILLLVAILCATLLQKSRVDEMPEMVAESVDIQEAPEVSSNPALEERNSGDARELAFIKNIYEKSGDVYIDADYFQWLSESEGTCFVPRESEPVRDLPECGPNAFLIVNENPQLRTFKLSPEVKIRVQKEGDSVLDSSTLSPKEFMNGVNNFGQKLYVYKLDSGTEEYVPFSLIFKAGEIVFIHEIYIP